jgi:putative membrane protein
MTEVSDMIATWGHAGGGLWFLFPLLWLAVIAGLFFLFRRRSWRYGRSASGADVLAERYARGEITEEEYRQRLRVLRERR